MYSNLFIRQVPAALRLCGMKSSIKEPLFTIKNKNYSLFEPDYLEAMRSKIPLYDTLNFQIKGYDFPVLESYQKFVRSIAESMEIDVADGWALSPHHLQIQKFKPRSAVIDTEYKLTMYERNIQLCDVPSTKYPIFLRLAQAALPQGVTINVHEHTDQHEELRYVPDKDLLELKSQLDELGGPLSKKK